MSANFDLHCHSHYSDGVLSPAEVVARAREKGVSVLALTDHDAVAGLPEARAAAQAIGLGFVNGVEISVTWEDTTIHIVGLRIDPQNPELEQGLERVRGSRARRAEAMAKELDRAGIEGSLEGAYAYAENPELIGRTHFARFLVANGHAPDVRRVFQHYLVKGKPGFVPHEWCALKDAVSWIRGAGGRAVMAHPGRYKVSPPDMTRLLNEFKDAGGEGIEVVTGSHSPEDYAVYATRAREFGFLASRGSDFHSPDEARIDLGGLPQLPSDLRPVWYDWV